MTVPGRPWLRAPNFGDVIAETVALDPERTMLLVGDVELTYGALDERSRRAAALVGRRVGPGEVVAIAVGNDWRFVELFLGVLRAGAVALLVNTKLGRDTLEYVAGHSEARLIVGHHESAAQAEALLAGAPEGCGLVEIGAGGGEYEQELATAQPAAESSAVDPDALAILMYTSGSTGRPKGVMLSHDNTWWTARNDVRTMLMDRHDRGLIMGPLYHANALWAILLPMLYAGGSAVVLPGFDPKTVLETIERHRVTYTSGTPSMYSLLLAEAGQRDYDVSSIELLQCGSAPVPQELMARILAYFECDLVETYGLTEGGATVLTPRWGIKKLGSAGLPVPEAQVRIVDPAAPERDVEVGEVGELWTRSPANAIGYLKDPDSTAAKFVGDGWLRTGDLFRGDEQGYLYFCGRTDDMISVGGENVYPKEVETLILGHPAVADVGVVPAAHPVKGQAPVAWVVLKPGRQASEQELREHALANGPAYAHPRRVFFVDALPISGTNKLDRTALERMTREELPDGLEPGRREPEPAAP